MKVLVCDDTGLREVETNKVDLDFLYSICCRDTPTNHIVELVGGRFSDHEIDAWVHEEGRLVPLPIYCIFGTGETLAGPVLFASTTDDGESVGLTDKQIEIVRNELRVLKTPVLDHSYV